MDSGAEYGTYNLTNSGDPQSWAEIAKDVYKLTGQDPAAVSGASTAEYFRGKAAASRPLNSTLDLSRIRATGFEPEDAATRLKEYLDS